MAALRTLPEIFKSASFVRTLFINTQSCTFSTVASESLDDELRLEYLDGDSEGIAVMSINRPAAKNSISRNLMRLLESHVDTLSADSRVRTVILRSIVPKVFCAGADLKERKAMTEADVPVFVSKGRNLSQRLSQMAVPTIAAIEGVALGGGLEMALACDFRVASSTAKLGLTETKLGIIPGGGGTVRLPRIVGISSAKELIFTGKVLNNVEASDIGLVDYAVDQNENGDGAYVKSLDLAKQIVVQGPIALRMAKKSINEGTEVGIEEALLVEERCYAQVIPTEDRMEALRAFAEKRKPVFLGR